MCLASSLAPACVKSVVHYGRNICTHSTHRHTLVMVSVCQVLVELTAVIATCILLSHKVMPVFSLTGTKTFFLWTFCVFWCVSESVSLLTLCLHPHKDKYLLLLLSSSFPLPPG